MPPKLNTSNHHSSDPDNEVVCPIKSADGSNCRKKCLGVRLPISSLCFCSVSQSPLLCRRRSCYLYSCCPCSMHHAAVPSAPQVVPLRRNASLSWSSQDEKATYKGIIGEAFPLDAGAYPTSASRVLYSKVAGNKGKLRLDDQLTAV